MQVIQESKQYKSYSTYSDRVEKQYHIRDIIKEITGEDNKSLFPNSFEPHIFHDMAFVESYTGAIEGKFVEHYYYLFEKVQKVVFYNRHWTRYSIWVK